MSFCNKLAFLVLITEKYVKQVVYQHNPTVTSRDIVGQMIKGSGWYVLYNMIVVMFIYFNIFQC